MFYYQPTALEEAYGIYLLQNEFQIVDVAASFRISGRQAVPFFCRSKMDRLVLRNMWTVVDPQVNGYMSEPIQFYTFLRLIALAQTGPLMMQLATAAQSGGVSPEDVMRQCLMQTAAMMFHLPVFEGVNIPSNMELQNVYQQAKMIPQQPPPTYVPNSFAPANQTSNYAPQQELPPSLAVAATVSQQQPETSSTSEVVVLPTKLELTSIDDAFSSLVDVQDKPLPSLYTNPVQDEKESTQPNGSDVVADISPASAVVVDVDDDEFGDFVDSGSNQGSLEVKSQDHSSSWTSPQVISSVASIVSVDPSTKGEISILDSSDLPANERNNAFMSLSQTNNPTIESEDFPERQNTNVYLQQVSHTPPQMDGENVKTSEESDHAQVPLSNDDFGDFTSSNNHHMSLNKDKTQSMSTNHESDFGNFPPTHLQVTSVGSNVSGEWVNATSTIGSNAASSINSVMSISDAFGGLVEVSDRPLPSIDTAATSNVVLSDSTAKEIEYLSHDQPSQSDVKEFDEVAAKVPIADTTMELFSPTFSQGTTNQSHSPSETIEATHSMTVTDDVLNMEKQQTNEDDTEFGDFAGIDPVESYQEETIEEITSLEPPDTTEATHSIIVPPASHDYLNSGFDENPAVVDNGLSGWDALDALSTFQDMPLPSLNTLSGDDGETLEIGGAKPNDTSKKQEEDDFGEFVGDSSVPTAHTSDNGFAAFQQSDSQNLSPSLVALPVATTTDVDDDNDFGNFLSGNDTDNKLSQSSAKDIEGSNLVDDVAEDDAESRYNNETTRNVTELIGFEESQPIQPKSSDWGSFEAVSGTTHDEPINAPASTDGNAEEIGSKLFGTLGVSISDGSEKQQMRESPAQSRPLVFGAGNDNDTETDDFGDFSGFAASGSLDNTSTFDVDSHAPPPVNSAPTDYDSSSLKGTHGFATIDDIRDGGTSPGNKKSKADESPTQLPPSSDNSVVGGVAEDDFGDFSGFAAFENTIHSGLEGHGSPTEEVGESNNMVQSPPDDVQGNSFGDFSGFESSPQVSNLVTVLKTDADAGLEDSDNFGDFASFETSQPQASSEDSEYNNLIALREIVQKTSLGLPEAIKAQSNGGRIDFANCFEANIGMDVPVSETRKKTIQRSIQIMQLLSSSHSKLASTYWEHALSLVRDEITMASIVLEEAVGFTEVSKAAVRPKLEKYVMGLGEFVRICRSIVATVGDLLMLHPSSLLTVDTLSSSWCSLNLLKNYLEIESGWKKVEEMAEKCSLEHKKDYLLETVSAIRIYGSEVAVPDNELCQFTLQPLSRNTPLITKSPVVFNNQTYMACAANFLTHKCPSYAQSGF